MSKLLASSPHLLVAPTAFGLLLALAFAPVDWWWMALLAPALLVALWQRTDWRDAPLQGFWFGVGWFLGGVHWIYYSIYQYGGTSFWLSVILNGVLILFMAGYVALLGWLGKRFLSRLSLSQQALGVVMLWPLMEWLRGTLLTGFPWLSIGYAHLQTPLSGFAPILGVYGVGMVSLFVSMGLAIPVLAILSPSQSLSTRQILYWLALTFLVLVLGVGLKQVEWTSSRGQPLRVAIVQGNINQSDKWRLEGRMRSLNIYQELTRENLDSELIVWPETAVPFFFGQVAPYLQRLSAEMRGNKVALLVGVPVREANGRYFNSVLGLGLAEGRYDKQHLVPFGEYVPLKVILGDLLQFLQVPMSNFSSGASGQPPIQIEGRRLATSICYEDLFAGELRDQALMSEILVNVTNDGWFGQTVAPAQHLQIARMRALEFGKPMVRAANTGISALIDAKGNSVSQSGQAERVVLKGQLQPKVGFTPYSAIADRWLVLVVFALLIIQRYGRKTAIVSV